MDEYLGLPSTKPNLNHTSTMLHVNATQEGEWAGSLEVGGLSGVRIEVSADPWLERSLWVDYRNPEGSEASVMLFKDVR